jgi:hypothetical protein
MKLRQVVDTTIDKFTSTVLRCCNTAMQTFITRFLVSIGNLGSSETRVVQALKARLCICKKYLKQSKESP